MRFRLVSPLATPPVEANFPDTFVWNSTSYNKNQDKALRHYGQPALTKAFHAEMIGMKAYIESKL